MNYNFYTMHLLQVVEVILEEDMIVEEEEEVIVEVVEDVIVEVVEVEVEEEEVEVEEEEREEIHAILLLTQTASHSLTVRPWRDTV